MIVLDAGVLIALLDSGDAHHEDAVALVEENLDESFAMSPLNLAEVLVRPARMGVDSAMMARISDFGIEQCALPGDAALRLAQLRAATDLKMPDCCVLLAAEQLSAAVATFDRRLAEGARTHGVAVLHPRA